MITQLKYGLYDWASSPVGALHATFVFPVYFATIVMPQGGTTAWAWMTAISALVIALLAPFLGALADQNAWRKIFLAIASAISIGAVASLWWIAPEAEYAALALGISAIVLIASELAFVFYNALLPRVAKPEEIGRVSGTAWGVGYIGAIICLFMVLMIFVMPDVPPFGLNKSNMEHIRITMVVVAFWYLIFALPFFFMVREGEASQERFFPALKEGWKIIYTTPGLLRFFIARLFYSDALITLFAMGGIFAARVHNFSQEDVLVFAIILNVTAGVGAIIGGVADDRIGSIRTIKFALIVMISIGVIAIITPWAMLFWVAGSMLGFFVGPLQASSRSHVARLIPPQTTARVFGFMTFTGKATAFLGPFLYGLLVMLSGSDALGMAVVVVLFILGLMLLPRSPHS